MPIVKAISGHTNCQKVKTYLEKRNRALARDFFNLSWDEREMQGYDEAMKDAVEWATRWTRHGPDAATTNRTRAGAPAPTSTSSSRPTPMTISIFPPCASSQERGP